MEREIESLEVLESYINEFIEVEENSKWAYPYRYDLNISLSDNKSGDDLGKINIPMAINPMGKWIIKNKKIVHIKHDRGVQLELWKKILQFISEEKEALKVKHLKNKIDAGKSAEKQLRSV